MADFDSTAINSKVGSPLKYIHSRFIPEIILFEHIFQTYDGKISAMVRSTEEKPTEQDWFNVEKALVDRHVQAPLSTPSPLEDAMADFYSTAINSKVGSPLKYIYTRRTIGAPDYCPPSWNSAMGHRFETYDEKIYVFVLSHSFPPSEEDWIVAESALQRINS